MTEREIYEYAIKGIFADIQELEKNVRKGQNLIREIENGKPSKVTPYEIREKIREFNAEIERLDKKKFELKWAVEVDMKESE